LQAEGILDGHAEEAEEPRQHERHEHRTDAEHGRREYVCDHDYIITTSG
jgi:hypothetical protein